MRAGVMRLEPEQMRIVEVAESYRFSVTRVGLDGDWYFYNWPGHLNIYFCGDLWSIQDRDIPHPEPERFGLDYIEVKHGRGAEALDKALKEIGNG